MVQKRPYDEEEIFKISFKHPRQIEDSKQLFSFSESVFSESASEMMPKTLGEHVATLTIQVKMESSCFFKPCFVVRAFCL
uniref:Uncharacterized protein n=1 Tax=Cannabis sativa TaxID=3483 RepID=A0A803R0B8_CANSA